MATSINTYDLVTLAKTSVDANDYLEIVNSSSRQYKKILVNSIFPSLVTTGTSSEDLYVSVTNKNQLNFKGIKSGDTDLLTVTTSSNNIVLTALEAGIDLSLCNNTTSAFLTEMDFTGSVTGECPVINGGTGLSTIAKGAILYADAADSITSTASSVNGQILVHNSTTGVPAWSTLDAGTNLTLDVSSAGVLKLDAALSTLAAELNASTYNINLNTAAGASWITGAAGQNEGMTVDADGKVFIGEATPTAFFDAALNIKGSITFAEDTAPTIKPKARSGSSGVNLTLEAGSASNQVGGDLILKGGSSTAGNYNAGNLKLYAGDEAGSGTAGSIQNYVSNGSGAEIEALTIVGGSATPAVKVGAGNLVITSATKGIVHEGSGTVTQATSHSTDISSGIDSTSGIITLAGVALAAGAEADFQVSNNTVQADSVILLTVQSPAAASATDNATLVAQLDGVSDNSFNIRLTNPGAGATSTGAHKIHFLVINNS